MGLAQSGRRSIALFTGLGQPRSSGSNFLVVTCTVQDKRTKLQAQQANCRPPRLDAQSQARATQNLELL